jgi:hypothetical protein
MSEKKFQQSFYLLKPDNIAPDFTLHCTPDQSLSLSQLIDTIANSSSFLPAFTAFFAFELTFSPTSFAVLLVEIDVMLSRQDMILPLDLSIERETRHQEGHLIGIWE